MLAGMLRPPGRSQRRILYRTERSLLADDPGFGSLFTIFTRLAWNDALPGTEQARPTRWQWRKLVIAAGLIVVMTALAVSSLALSPHACGATPALGQRHSANQATSCQPGPAPVRGR